MTWRGETRESAGRHAELRLEHRHTDPDASPFHKEYKRLAGILEFLRITVDSAHQNTDVAEATRLTSRATRETVAATRQAAARLRQVLKSTKVQIHSVQRLKPRVNAAWHAPSGDERSSTWALPAAVAHEINNPLEAIANLLYLLENEATLSDKGRECVAVIKGEVGRIAEIAQRALAKYRQTPSPEIVNVAEVIESVLDLYKSRFETKGISITREHQFRGSIRAHRTQIREVFANLFLNAIDAMSCGGRLRIRTSAAREWRGQQRHGVRILVADNGCGVATEHLNKIFKPSFTTKGERGTGIGLSIVQAMLRDHRGTIRIRSSIREARSGTIFSIFLPGETRSDLAAA